MCWRRICILIALAACVPVVTAAPALRPFTQQDAIILAARDVTQQPDARFPGIGVALALREYTRYLWLGNLPADSLADALRVLNGHANGMSPEPDLVPLAVVPGSESRLLRLNLEDYRWKAATWDLFRNVDPYFWTRVERYFEAGYDGKTGERWTAGNYAVPAVGGWVAESPEAKVSLSLLIEATQAKAPVVSAASFLFQTMVCTNGKPNYRDFLGYQTEAEFLKLGGVKADEDERLSGLLLSVVAESGITYEPRALERQNAITGAFWRSHDFKKAEAAKNPLRVLGADKAKVRAKADAHEDYLHLPSGLWAVGLFNDVGAAQDNAPDTITTGDTTTSDPRDHRVHCPLSCIRCHDRGGLKDLDDWTRNLLEPPPGLNLQSPDFREAQRLRRQYVRKLEPFLERDRKVYADALKEIAGLSPEDYAAAYGDLWTQVAEKRYDSAAAAADLFVTEAEFLAALDRQLQASRKGTGEPLDTLLSGYLKPREKQRPLQTRQWWESLPVAQAYLRGVVPLKLKKVGSP